MIPRIFIPIEDKNTKQEEKTPINSSRSHHGMMHRTQKWEHPRRIQVNDLLFKHSLRSPPTAWWPMTLHLPKGEAWPGCVDLVGLARRSASQCGWAAGRLDGWLVQADRQSTLMEVTPMRSVTASPPTHPGMLVGFSFFFFLSYSLLHPRMHTHTQIMKNSWVTEKRIKTKF